MNKIEGTAEAWEDGRLGMNPARAVAAGKDVEKAMDEALGLQPISIRLQKDLLEELKMIARLNGLGYQPLIRQVLTRFVACELKSMLRDKIAEQEVAQELVVKAVIAEKRAA